MKLLSSLCPGLILTTLAAIAVAGPMAHAAEHITLRNGAEFDCLRQESFGDHVRLYLIPTAARATSDDLNYLEVPATSVLRVDLIPNPPAPLVGSSLLSSHSALSSHSSADGSASSTPLTPATMRTMLDQAGAQHNIDADLLASIVHAESAGNPHAVSRAGARGLMQLMPATASLFGVTNSFAPDQNISGGTTYFDQLLTRYHDDIRLAVAAYNAGPAAVDRYHGIPPFAETRAYVARVVREFNHRKLAATHHTTATALAAVAAAN